MDRDAELLSVKFNNNHLVDQCKCIFEIEKKMRLLSFVLFSVHLGK